MFLLTVKSFYDIVPATSIKLLALPPSTIEQKANTTKNKAIIAIKAFVLNIWQALIFLKHSLSKLTRVFFLETVFKQGKKIELI